jgi:hypothetical protein
VPGLGIIGRASLVVPTQTVGGSQLRAFKICFRPPGPPGISRTATYATAFLACALI